MILGAGNIELKALHEAIDRQLDTILLVHLRQWLVKADAIIKHDRLHIQI